MVSTCCWFRKRGANGTSSTDQTMVHAAAECRKSGGTPSRRMMSFSALTIGACARKKMRQRPMLSRSAGCCRAKAVQGDAHTCE